MDKSIVIDSSVALKWFLDDEAGISAARGILSECLSETMNILVPSHFHSEVGNGLIMALRRKRVEEIRFKEAWKDFIMIPFSCVPWSHPLCNMTIDFALQTGLTFYDAAYIALAKVEEVSIFTGDRDISEAAKKLNLLPLYIG